MVMATTSIVLSGDGDGIRNDDVVLGSWGGEQWMIADSNGW